MGGTPIRALALAILLALPGCAWLGPSPAQQQLRDARRARSEAGDELAPKHKTVEERLAEADRYLADGRGGQAVWGYLEAHRADPSALSPRLRIGYVELPRDPERAEALFTAIVRDEPDSAEAHAGLGLARYAQNRLEPARDELERAVALDPASARALAWLAVVYDALGDSLRSRDCAERAHRLRPDDPRIVNSLGVSELVSGDFASAEQAFRSAILLEPDDPILRNNLGLALGRQHRYEEAYAEFRRAGAEPAALNNLGYLYYLNGEHAKAIEIFERSLEAGGGDERITVVRNLEAARAALERSR
jgi:Flp pilus assembly protein TadD